MIVLERVHLKLACVVIQNPLNCSSVACWQVGEIITRFERKGFQIVGLKMFQTPKSLAEVSNH
jgi:hypothetical protein